MVQLRQMKEGFHEREGGCCMSSLKHETTRRHPLQVGRCIRSAGNDPVWITDDVSLLCKARGAQVEFANLLADWDYPFFRARRSHGWKEHKARHQWEHGVKNREKHAKNKGSWTDEEEGKKDNDSYLFSRNHLKSTLNQ